MDGLNRQDVEYRISNGLVNNKNVKHSRSIKTIILSNTITLFNMINVVLFILVLTTGQFANATFLGVIIINTLISIYQEIKAKKIIDGLTIANSDKVTVVREGKKEQINTWDIVIDDILCLTVGDDICVDAVIVKGSNCEVDESVITGESDAITKNVGDKLISGTVITSGEVYAKVISINEDTYASNLVKEAATIKENTSYLKKSINSILKVVTVLIVPTAVLLFVSQYFYNKNSYSEAILGAVAGVNGMIPEGLMLLTSIALTVGVIKMAKKKVIIQKLNGIELLACVDVLCLDKTGTITDGTMEVVDVLKLNEKYDVNKIVGNMLDKDINATDKALSKYFSKNNDYEIVKRIPFSSSRKYSAVSFKEGDYGLGALEYLTDKKIEDYPELVKYTDKGYRILTLAKGKVEGNIMVNSKVIAFIIIKDNVRKNAKETLEYFKSQDVSLKIISGDNPLTVSNIVKYLDFDGYDKYISGKDLPEDYEKLKSIVNEYMIFGRVTPEQKKMIVKALKEDKTVGMIGDGVNDILALKESDCGIALANGVSAARNVAEVVLTDADFGILPDIVNEGRRVVNNIERVSSMYLIKTIYSFILSILSIILAHEYPFYPVQLSLIGAFCVGIPSFFLALEPNYTKVKKGFMVKVFRNALPAGLCVFINIFFIIMISNIFNVDFDSLRFVVVGATGYLNLYLLYKICSPLTLIRKILLVACSISFVLSMILFREFLLLSIPNVWGIILMVLLILADNYIVWLFTLIYDFIVKLFGGKK